MDWYYGKDGQRVGPVSQDELTRLMQTGVIGPSTLVWHSGMQDWQPYSVAIGMPPLPGGAAPQMAMNGVGPAGRYAGFWIRFFAYVIDGILIGMIRAIIIVPLGFRILDDPSPWSPFFWEHVGEAQLSSFLISICYFVFFWVQYGATPGKMLLKLKVVTPEGGRITMQQGVIRYFATILSGMILGIGFIMAAFDDEKRALHDRLAKTRVVRGREFEPTGF